MMVGTCFKMQATNKSKEGKKKGWMNYSNMLIFVESR